MCSKTAGCYWLKTPSRHRWTSWTVGTYVYAWLPKNSHEWRNCPVLLVDIRKEDTGEIRFIVAYLYDQHAAAERLRTVVNPAQGKAAISLRTWPQGFKYVLSNHFDTVYEWELRTWSRSDLESITPHWALNIRTNRLESFPGMESDMVLDTNPGPSRFLQLPCEIREQIYNYALFDERQQTSRSYIYTRSLLLKRKYNEQGWPWHRSLSMPTLGPIPRLQTPNIFLICKQIYTEALEAVYRTKTLVVTVTSTAGIFYSLDKDWSPLNICHFLRIRIDLILDCVTPEMLQDCCSGIASLLQAQARSLQFLEVRIGFPLSEVSAGVRGAGSQVQIGPDDIADSMQGFNNLLQRSRLGENAERKPMQISWGISELQKSAGDYSCACIYLRARYLSQLWSFVCDGLSGSSEVASSALLGENCQDMGCKLVHH